MTDTQAPGAPKYQLKPTVSLFIEKVATTFVFTFASFLLTLDALDADAATAATLAGIAAAGTAALAALPIVPNGLPFYTDLLYRAVRAYVVAAGTLFFAAPQLDLSMGAGKAALIGALPVVFTLVKGALASKVGDQASAALLPAKLDPAQFAIAA